MKYTKEQRLEIGKRIYDGELSRYEAAEEYGISDITARDYMSRAGTPTDNAAMLVFFVAVICK